jgi:hypothetical protein
LTLACDHTSLLVLAPAPYWTGFLSHNTMGCCWHELLGLASQLEAAIGVRAELAALSPCDFDMGSAEVRPTLHTGCSIESLAELRGRMLRLTPRSATP